MTTAPRRRHPRRAGEHASACATHGFTPAVAGQQPSEVYGSGSPSGRLFASGCAAHVDTVRLHGHLHVLCAFTTSMTRVPPTPAGPRSAGLPSRWAAGHAGSGYGSTGVRRSIGGAGSARRTSCMRPGLSPVTAIRPPARNGIEARQTGLRSLSRVYRYSEAPGALRSAQCTDTYPRRAGESHVRTVRTSMRAHSNASKQGLCAVTVTVSLLWTVTGRTLPIAAFIASWTSDIDASSRIRGSRDLTLVSGFRWLILSPTRLTSTWRGDLKDRPRGSGTRPGSSRLTFSAHLGRSDWVSPENPRQKGRRPLARPPTQSRPTTGVRRAGPRTTVCGPPLSLVKRR